MKKLIFLIAALFFASVVSTSAKNVFYRTGYRANVGLGALFICGTPASEASALNIETVHGYSFGNGLFAGAGVGCMKGDSESQIVPIFAEAKYDFFNSLITPFVAARVGVAVLPKGNGASFYLSPLAGVEIWRFSLAFNYTMLGKGNTMNIIGGTLYFNF